MQLDRRLVGAVEPGGHAAGQHHRAERPALRSPRPQSSTGRLDDVSMLSVTVVQEASGLDPADNRARLHDLVPSDSDLVVLPEAFARDFGEAGSDVSPYAEALDGAVRDRAGRGRRRAQHHGRGRDVRDAPRTRRGPTTPCWCAAPPPRRTARSTSTTRSATGSPTRCTPGRSPPWWSTSRGFRVGLMTCYDLRFPELARLLVDRGAEVLVVPAAWVAGPRKVEHWRTLVRARAIENTVFVVAAGQPGPRYTGHSMVVDPLGDVLAEAGEEAAVLRATLDRERPRARPGGPTPPSPTDRLPPHRSVTCSVVPRTAPRRRATRHERVKVRAGRRRLPSPASAPVRSPVAPVREEIVPGRPPADAELTVTRPGRRSGPEPAARRPLAAGGRRRPGRPGRGAGPGRPGLAGRRRRGGRRDGVLLGAGGPHRRPPGRLRRPGPGARRAGARCSTRTTCAPAPR